MGPFTTLYIDMNSFFASVEQQLNPALRARPVAITATEGNHGACVAASYEAKAYGVKTGTSVRDARRMCPGIVFLPSRHRTYVRFNLRVADVIDRYAELERIRSVDEFQVVLSGGNTTLEGASQLVAVLKSAVAAEVGECLRFSAGIGPNQLLAKIAGKLQKPNGFSWLSTDNLPDALAHLALDDLPGISSSMRGRLERSGIRDVPSLHRLDPRHARAIWNSVEGERFVRSLQGAPIPLVETKRGGFGNSKVLAPAFRQPKTAYLVARWLTEKAASRLRRENRVAASFALSLHPLDRPRWGASLRCAATQDTAEFLRINRSLWRSAWPSIRGAQILSVGIQLGNTDLLSSRSGDLLSNLAPAERSRGEKASFAVDFINSRFGDDTIRFGINKAHPGFFERE